VLLKVGYCDVALAQREIRIYAANPKSAWYSRSCVRSAQTIRAFLFASATATTFWWRRPFSLARQLVRKGLANFCSSDLHAALYRLRDGCSILPI
jgi:hypothetical protein